MNKLKECIDKNFYKTTRKNVSFDVRSQVGANVFVSVRAIVRCQMFWPIWEELNEQLY